MRLPIKNINNTDKIKNIKVIQELHNLGITGYHEVSYNPTFEELFKAENSIGNSLEIIDEILK